MAQIEPLLPVWQTFVSEFPKLYPFPCSIHNDSRCFWLNDIYRLLILSSLFSSFSITTSRNFFTECYFPNLSVCLVVFSPPSPTTARSQLYRQTHASFEDYCRERWDMSRDYARKLIASYRAVDNINTTVSVLPKNEAQVRPLTQLNPKQQIEAWNRAVETAP